jgi:hypothetical protein
VRIRCCCLKWFGVALCWLLLSGLAFGATDRSYTKIGQNITVGPNEQVADLTCVACSIRVRGQVAGDVTAVGGSIVIESPAQVAGDITAVAGDVRLEQGVKIAGNATVVGGDLHRDPQATVAGDVTTMGGRGWVLPVLLAPFIVLGLLIALVVWLVQRARRPSLPAAAA